MASPVCKQIPHDRIKHLFVSVWVDKEEENMFADRLADYLDGAFQSIAAEIIRQCLKYNKIQASDLKFPDRPGTVFTLAIDVIVPESPPNNLQLWLEEHGYARPIPNRETRGDGSRD